jgi:hypothetical protein
MWDATQPKPSYEYYDIGFITFDAPISRVKEVGIIPSSSPVQAGEKAIIAGFGYDETQTSGELIAGYSSLDTVGEAVITTKFRGFPGESATCPGDSGGPLLVRRNGSWVLAGIASYGPLDCGPNYRFGFTNIWFSSLYNFLADSTCTIFTKDSGCPFFVELGPNGNN